MGYKFEKIDEFRSDVLREIGTIGSGNAANTLSAMLNDEVKISIPSVKFLDVNDAAGMLGGMENISVGIFSEVSGDITGFIMLVFNFDTANQLLERFIGESMTDGKFTEMQLSALSEIGNIMASAYASSISNLLQYTLRTSIPHICIDMVGAILSIPSIQMSGVSDKIVFIENHLLHSQLSSGAEMFLIPDVESFHKIMESLGV